jgi:3-oxoacyl-(acyl-carrier-protein) synthase
MSVNPRIKMITGVAGVDFSVSPGDETDRFSEGEARRMVAGGIAEPTKETAEAWAKADAPAAPATPAKPARAARPAAPKA